MASAMPAGSSENLQLSQRNGGPESATITRDLSLQSTKGKYSRRATCYMTKVPLHDRINQFPNHENKRLLIKENQDLFAMVLESTI